MLRRHLSITEKLKISALTKAGHRQRAIARALHIDVKQVRRFQRESGLPMPSNALREDLVRQIIKLTNKGIAQNKIARRLNVDSQSVRKYQRLARSKDQRAA
jgi:DNA-binding CsgD family transcriptional regulator